MPAAEVTLRDFRPADAEAVHRWFNDERVTADLVGSRDSFTLDDARGWVERAIDTSADRKWAITIDGSDDAVGFVALFGVERPLGPELAVLVGEPAAWGKGVAREAERQACNRAFSEHRSHRVHAEIPATNRRRPEGRDVPRLPPRGDDARRDPPRRRGDRQSDLGPAAGGLHRLGRGLRPAAVRVSGAHRAELIPDRGAAAAGEADLFRSPAYLATEGVTHTLTIESPGLRTLIPVIVREVPGGDAIDAVSPYGYPGGSGAGRRRARPPRRRSTGARPASSASSFATGSATPALAADPGADPTAVVRIHDPRAAASGPPAARRAGARRRAGRVDGRVTVAGAERLRARSSTPSSRSTSRRCAGPRRARATSSTARSTRPRSPSPAAPCCSPARRRESRPPRRSSRRATSTSTTSSAAPPTTALADVAVQERRRRDARPRRRGRAPLNLGGGLSARRRPRALQARLRERRGSRGSPTGSSATRRSTPSSPVERRPTGSSRPTGA